MEMYCKDTFEFWRKYFTELLAETANAAAQGGSLEEVKGKVIPTLLSKYGAQFPLAFSKTVVANVETAYRIITTQTK